MWGLEVSGLRKGDLGRRGLGVSVKGLGPQTGRA